MERSAERGVPDAGELLQAVRGLLAGDVRSATEGGLRFNVRVAENVLAMVERELALGADTELRHAQRLATLDVADDRELCEAIAGGRMDDRLAELIELLRARTIERLLISNPRHLCAADAAHGQRAKE